MSAGFIASAILPPESLATTYAASTAISTDPSAVMKAIRRWAFMETVILKAAVRWKDAGGAAGPCHRGPGNAERLPQVGFGQPLHGITQPIVHR